MTLASIRRLQVRPIQSVDLAFNMAGILSAQHPTWAQLGHRIKPQDVPNIQTMVYDKLGDARNNSTKRGRARLVFDAAKIANTLDPVAMFTLRNHALAAQVTQSVANREREFLRRHAHHAEIIAEFEKVFPSTPDNVGNPQQITDKLPKSKLGLLDALQKVLGEKFLRLNSKYSPSSADEDLLEQVSSVTKPSGNFISTSETKGFGTKINQGETKFYKGEVKPENLTQIVQHAETKNRPFYYDGSGNEQDLKQAYQPANQVTTKYAALGFKRETDTDLAELKDRPSDNRARYLRHQLTLQEEYLNKSLFSFQVPYMDTMLADELISLDMEVRRLQLNLAHTYLVPPIPGVVTAVFKDLGESVTAGEPVLTIENDAEIYLLGRIKFRGGLRVTEPSETGQATLKTTDLFEANEPLEIKNIKICAVRGHDSDNDEWEVVFRCKNPLDDQNRPKLPLNYAFDRHNTSLDITF